MAQLAVARVLVKIGLAAATRTQRTPASSGALPMGSPLRSQSMERRSARFCEERTSPTFSPGGRGFLSMYS